MGTIIGAVYDHLVSKAAVTGAVKNWNLARFPSLHHRKEGCLRHQKNFAKPPKLTQTGWFSFCSDRKTTPSSRSADASRYFLDRSATPPCGNARRGVAPTVALRQFFHSSTGGALKDAYGWHRGTTCDHQGGNHAPSGTSPSGLISLMGKDGICGDSHALSRALLMQKMRMPLLVRHVWIRHGF